MNIKEVFEKYKHLDQLLTDKQWLPGNWQGCILYDLWRAIRDAQKGNCTWKLQRDFDSEYWETDCGQAWELSNDGTLEENGMRFCHGCGHPIVAVAADVPEVEDDDDDR